MSFQISAFQNDAFQTNIGAFSKTQATGIEMVYTDSTRVVLTGVDGVEMDGSLVRQNPIAGVDLD